MTGKSAGRYPQWVQELVHEWRSRLIPEWRVVLMAEPMEGDSEGKSGQAQANPVYRRLNVWLDLEHRDRRDIEETLVHELLHGALDPVVDAYRPALEHMGFIERKLVNRTAEVAEEHLVEWLARVLVSLKHGEHELSNLRVAEPAS